MKTQAIIESSLSNSNEKFINHYFRKYDKPQNPPAWMTLEILSPAMKGQFQYPIEIAFHLVGTNFIFVAA